jgi:outer membrane protein OmpU
MKNITKQKEISMNNLKKIGLSALAGSLAAFSANAAEMSVSGSAKVTYNEGSGVTANPYGMNTSLGFTGSGDVNGYATTLFMTMADTHTGMSSASLSVDLGDMGKLTFDQGVGVGGISTIDDKTPSAAEEVWDGLATGGTADENGLVGGGNSGVFVYSNSYEGYNFTGQYGKGGSNIKSDDGSSEAISASGSSFDFAVTTDALMPGLSAGAGYGEIANAGAGTNGNKEDAHYTAFATYTMSGVTVGYQESMVEDNTTGGADEQAQGWGVAVNLMDGLSASYGEREVVFNNPSAADVTADEEGVAVAYTMGSAKITIQNNEVTNNGGTTGSNDENTEIALSLAF